MQLSELAREQYCYLTTTGRVIGEPREIEIWFALVEADDAAEPAAPRAQGAMVYLIAGGGLASNWVRNLRKNPHCSVRIDSETFAGVARTGLGEQAEDDAFARRLLFEKYAPGYSGSLEAWARDGLPVAIDLDSG